MAVKLRIFILFFIFIYLQSFGIPIIHAEFSGDGNQVITGANSGKIVGEIFIINLIENNDIIQHVKTGTTISGVSCYGGWIKSGTQAEIGNNTSEVTIQFVSAVKGMNSVVYIGQDTAQSGGTVNVLFESADNIVSATAIIAGTSKYQLSGTTLAQKLVIWASGTSQWVVDEVGSPSVDWD